ncbi:zinc finger protein 567-like [Aphis craccivora]|uniref:Zinc finger protein 567-like n=1 Tax=Aphis craccivora TaxID=307492 RepID=A0A6G0YJC9_APHCR|nr:zinc finger protein 567-like [Aphis craccivora]
MKFLIQILISGYDYDQPKKTRYFCPNNCGKSYKFSNTLNRHVKYECGDLQYNYKILIRLNYE